MRIAYDHQIFDCSEYGGVARYFFELANNVATEDFASVAVCSLFHVNSYLQAKATQLQVFGKKMKPVKYSGRIRRQMNRLAVPFIMNRFEPDLVHETYYSEKSVAPVGSKVVLTVFDMIHERFHECFQKTEPTAARKAAAVKRADHIICISEQTRQDLIQILNVNPEKTSVVHLGFSLTKTSSNRLGKCTRPYLLYVGRRSGYKNFDALLRVYAGNALLQNGYDLIAFGGGELTARERALIRKLGVEPGRVQQCGGGDEVLAELYRSASLFVYPSLYEGFGIPPLEAMSFDCPVVCSNTSSIPEVVGDAAEFFDPHSVDSIGDAIERVLCNDALQRTLVMRGRSRVTLFSWKQCAEQTLEVYKSVLK